MKLFSVLVLALVATVANAQFGLGGLGGLAGGLAGGAARRGLGAGECSKNPETIKLVD